MVLVFLTLMELFAPEADGCLTYGLWILEGDLYRWMVLLSYMLALMESVGWWEILCALGLWGPLPGHDSAAPPVQSGEDLGRKEDQGFPVLLLQNRIWTADRLHARGWRHDDKCSLYDQCLESASYLFITYPFARELWFLLSDRSPGIAPVALSSTTRLWLNPAGGSFWRWVSLLLPKTAYFLWHIEREG